ncbi:hypothetical protein Tco_1432575 [Tanacetum coccineum]
MVACLEKSEGNADFHEIVDFLTASTTHYALTISPTIYASYIEQFWNTTHSQTVNDVKLIHAIVAGKTVVILESSVRSDLYFNDEDEPFNDVYQTPAHTKKVFTNMKRKGKDFSGRVTPLFASMLAPPVVEGEGGNTSRSDEEILEQDDLTDFVPPTPYDSPLLGGHTPGSDEGRPNIHELMAICTNLSNRVLALEQLKTAQDLVIRKLKKKVRKLEKKLRARTPGLNLFKIGTSKRKSLDKENVSKQGRKSDKTKPMDIVNTASIAVSTAGPSNVSTAEPFTSTAEDIFKDEMMTIVDTLMAIRSTRPRKTSVVIHDVEEELRRATPVPIV